ncbi:unnamed protein product [Calypogeia fissa]
MGDNSKVYKDLLEKMMMELDGGCQPDDMAVGQLRNAWNALAHCGEEGKRVGKRKRQLKSAMEKILRLNVAMAIWKDVLDPYTLPKNYEENAFQRDFTMNGIMGGIVGALAMTIEDPPRLVYDYYNGGNLSDFIDKCAKYTKGKRKGKKPAEDKFISERQLSQCALQEHHLQATDEEEIASFRADHPQLAPELVREKPTPYNKATDIYALGNLFETLLQAEDDWDGKSRNSRILQQGWNVEYYRPRLDQMVGNMMATNPKKRLDCIHWSMFMVRGFPDSKLRLQNSPYLRD